METEFNVREEFPALLADPEVIFADAATGTQVHESVPEAMTAYLRAPNANLGGENRGGVNAIRQVREARDAVAAFLNCKPEEVTIGPNMTTLTFHLSHSLALELASDQPKNIVVTRLDHDANVSPWLKMADKIGAEVKWVKLTDGGSRLDQEQFETLVDEQTVFVAIGYASNACGTINPVKDMIRTARNKAKNALTFVDAVHYAPHGLIDVKDLDTDFLACSPYKFFGPHTGVLYGRAELMESKLSPYKLSLTYQVDVATELLPGDVTQQSRWEQGTLNMEGAAGIKAAIEYIASLGVRFGGASKNSSLRSRLSAGYKAIRAHENRLSRTFLSGIEGTKGLKLLGYDKNNVDKRTSTFALVADKFPTVQDFNRRLLQEGLVAGASNFYAKYWSNDLDLERIGGYVRISFVHYNSVEDATKAAEIVKMVAEQGPI